MASLTFPTMAPSALPARRPSFAGRYPLSGGRIVPSVAGKCSVLQTLLRESIVKPAALVGCGGVPQPEAAEKPAGYIPVYVMLPVVMSFHQCGGNVGDDVFIPLPRWVLDVAGKDPDVLFTDRDGRRNAECLSWGVDNVPAIAGRTALEVYTDYMTSFRATFDTFFEAGWISEVEIGLGPCGELRYPAYPATNGWRYPGIGQFQCYDAYMREDLRLAAEAVGEPLWALPPESCGDYNCVAPDKTDFFKPRLGEYNGFRGRFFLRWYSEVLVSHADALLARAHRVFGETPIAAKVAGVHWHYQAESHAAELTAGFYNTLGTQGYASIISVLKKHHTALNFTCVELSTAEQHVSFPDARADPEALVWQVSQEAWIAGVPVAAENALPCYHKDGYDRILRSARPSGAPHARPSIMGFTYLRLNYELIDDDQKLKTFAEFVGKMHVPV